MGQAPRPSGVARQNGFGVFSVSPSLVPKVTDYIVNQEKTTAPGASQNEFRELLQKNGVEWDERYVWD